MENVPTLNLSQAYGRNREKSNQYLNNETVFLYANQVIKGYFQRGINLVTRRPGQLADLNTVLLCRQIKNSHYLGIRSVKLDQIQGSEGRSKDFDRFFHSRQDRTRSRWITVASARMTGKELPPIELIQIGEIYFVRDGHHRISVARALGEKYLDAIITKFEIQPNCQEPCLS